MRLVIRVLARDWNRLWPFNEDRALLCPDGTGADRQNLESARPCRRSRNLTGGLRARRTAAI